jgi:uncharacterized protein YggE
MKTETYLVIIAVLAIFVMGAVLAAAVLYPGGLTGVTGTQNNYITVTAQGFAYGYPSEAVIYLYLNGSGPDSAIATSNASLTLQKLNFSLNKYINENTSEIKTLSYQLSKEHNSSIYEVDEDLEVTIPNIQNVSTVLQNLSSIQNIYVQTVSPTLSDSQKVKLRNLALSDALTNATTQAKVLAQNMTVTTHNITVTSFNVFYPYSLNAAASPSGGIGNKGTLIYSGENQVSETVTVQFSYK